MRAVFSSPRLENVEAVAKLLEEAGIEVRVSNDRSYKGNRRQAFSYRDSNNAEPNPQVWIIKAEDQPKAREMLREAGLIDSAKFGYTRPEDNEGSTFLPQSATTPIAPKPDRRISFAMRFRLLLLVIISALVILTVLHR
jgi:hypothetical protein